MEMFPFFRRPYYYYAQNGYMNPVYKQEHNSNQNQIQEYINHREEKHNEAVEEKKGHTERNKKNLERGEEPVFEIFGIKLYFDDILIIALIFFLYNEGVEDSLLFISLILLLLS